MLVQQISIGQSQKSPHVCNMDFNACGSPKKHLQHEGNICNVHQESLMPHVRVFAAKHTQLQHVKKYICGIKNQRPSSPDLRSRRPSSLATKPAHQEYTTKATLQTYTKNHCCLTSGCSQQNTHRVQHVKKYICGKNQRSFSIDPGSHRRAHRQISLTKNTPRRQHLQIHQETLLPHVCVFATKQT
jgi:hypothetical protein